MITHNRDIPASFLYRLSAFYFVITVLPFPLRFLPFLNVLSNWYNTAFDVIVSYTGTHIFDISDQLVSSSNGSGDTSYNYVRLFVVVILAFVATFLSYAWEKGRRERGIILWRWIAVYLQFWFGMTMIEYGIDKVIKVQFPFPYSSLAQTYGDSSPMRLLWSFMGYSTPYNIFTGSIEIIAGTLVLFKKWFLLGILLSLAVLTNVVALNFCYDVPVKLFSLTFLLTAVFLVSPYMKMLASFFISSKAMPADSGPANLYKTKRTKQMGFVVKSILVVCVLYSFISHSLLRYTATGDGSFVRTPLFGIYHVKNVVASGQNPALQTPAISRWKTLTILPLKQASVQTEEGRIEKYRFSTDTIHKTITIQELRGGGHAFQMLYTFPDANQLVLTGMPGDDSVSVILQKQDLNHYDLMNRSFHWISESPYK